MSHGGRLGKVGKVGKVGGGGGRWGGGEEEGRTEGGREERRRRGEGYSMNHGAAPHNSSFTLLQHGLNFQRESYSIRGPGNSYVGGAVLVLVVVLRVRVQVII